MAKTKDDPADSQAIHPPKQRGRRLTPQQLAQAIANSTRDKVSANQVLDERDFAIQKVQYVEDNPGALPDPEARLRSAIETIALTTKPIRAAQYRQVDANAHLKEISHKDRPNSITSELAKLDQEYPGASAKWLEGVFFQRAKKGEIPCIEVSSEGVLTDAITGKQLTLSFGAIGGRIYRLRDKASKKLVGK